MFSLAWQKRNQSWTRGNCAGMPYAIVQSILEETCTKTLRFEKHKIIKDSWQYLPGDQVSNTHKTTSFSMNYKE